MTTTLDGLRHRFSARRRALCRCLWMRRDYYGPCREDGAASRETTYILRLVAAISPMMLRW